MSGMQRAHRDSLPKLVQPGRRRSKWEEEQRGEWVKGGPETGDGSTHNRQHVRMRASHGRKRGRGPGALNNADPQLAQPWKLKKKGADQGGISGGTP